MKAAEIIKALSLGEDESWEFKDGRGGIGSSVLETVSAFANTEGGIIICGVLSKDNDRTHEPVGVKDAKKYVTNVWNALNNREQISGSPCISKDIWAAIVGGCNLICIRVPEADRKHRPVYVGKNPLTGTFKRRNSGDYPCNEDEVRQMMRDASSDPQDAQIFDGTTFDDLDYGTFRGYRNVFASRRPTHAFLRLDNADLLKKLGGSKEGKKTGLTAAGILMFGSADLIRDSFPKLFLDYYELAQPGPGRRFDDRITSYDGDWEPNLFNFFFKAYERLTGGLRVPFGLDEMAMRTAETPFHHALREALVNSLVHADFQSSGTILIGKRNDAFVFSNPGRSLTPISRIVEARHAGDKLSDVRNPNLVGMFFHAGLAERQGTGYPTIFHAWDEGKRHSPRIEEDLERNVVTVTLPLLSQVSPAVENDLQRLIGPQYALLSSLEKDILIEAYQFGETSNEALQFSHTEHPRDIGVKLKSLCEQGWLVRDGTSGRGRTYRLRQKDARDLFHHDPTPFTPSGLSASPQWGEGSPAYQRASREGVESIILQLCTGEYRTAKELAALMKRKTPKLRESYLSRMVADGRLVMRHPEAHAHPQQAYRAANT